MKTIFLLVVILAGLSANAQPTNTGSSLESQLTTRIGKAVARAAREVKPNEVVKGRVTYSGIAVQVLKGANLLQLINPAAPPEYGSPEDNVFRDPISGKVSGWKLFSIRF
jgi:hypothetical protein